MKDKGEIFYRDMHGNFHKLSTQEISNSMDDFLEFDNILSSDKFIMHNCINKSLNYYELNLKKLKGNDIKNNEIILQKGLYRFFIFLTIFTLHTQRIYSFMRKEKIFDSSLKTEIIYSNVPNNLSFNFVFEIENMDKLNFGLISEKEISNIKSYIMYVKIN